MTLLSLPAGTARFSLCLSLLVAAVAMGVARPATAADSGDSTAAVLGVEALDGAPDNIAADITDSLRQRISATKGYQLVQGKDLVEVKLVFSCADEGPACMSQAGKSMGVAKLIFGSVKRSGGDFLVTLKLLDVARGTIEGSTSDTVPRKRADPASLRLLAPAWVAKLTGKSSGGALAVRANVEGAAVSLDGTKVGITGAQPVTIADVPPGPHQVTLEKNGYTTSRQEFTLSAGQSLPLSLSLSALSGDVGSAQPAPVLVRRPASPGADESGEPGPDSGGSRSLSRTGFWVAVVGTLASAGLALKFGNDVRQINNTLDQYRRFPCPGSDTGLCDTHGDPRQRLTPQEQQIVDGKTSDGNRAQTLQWVFVGLVPPFAIAGGYLLYKGYLESESSREGGSGGSAGASRTGSRSSSGSSDHGLRIFPTASASAGGIIAEFDF